MTETMRHRLCLITGGTAALLTLAVLDVAAGPRLGLDDHETLISLVRRLALWMAAACSAFVAVRPLRPATGRGQ